MCIQFAVFLLVILITEIAIGIVAFVNRDGWGTAIHDSIKKTFDEYDKGGQIQADIDDLQKTVSYTGEIRVHSHFYNCYSKPLPVWMCKNVLM
jgi:hypothetical protein